MVKCGGSCNYIRIDSICTNRSEQSACTQSAAFCQASGCPRSKSYILSRVHEIIWRCPPQAPWEALLNRYPCRVTQALPLPPNAVCPAYGWPFLIFRKHDAITTRRCRPPFRIASKPTVACCGRAQQDVGEYCRQDIYHANYTHRFCDSLASAVHQFSLQPAAGIEHLPTCASELANIQRTEPYNIITMKAPRRP